LAFLCTFGIFYGHLVYFSRFGILHQEKSGNPGRNPGKEGFTFNWLICHKSRDI
jgi:hypothetical protein